jgi:STE24 endopeptidase
MQTFTVIFVTALALARSPNCGWAGAYRAHPAPSRSSAREFANDISLDAHRKAADYSSAKTRFSLVSVLFECMVILLLTFGGLLQFLHELTSAWFAPGVMRGVALMVVLAAIMTLVDIPFGWYRTFGIEHRFGFNKMTPALFFAIR